MRSFASAEDNIHTSSTGAQFGSRSLGAPFPGWSSSRTLSEYFDEAQALALLYWNRHMKILCCQYVPAQMVSAVEEHGTMLSRPGTFANLAWSRRDRHGTSVCRIVESIIMGALLPYSCFPPHLAQHGSRTWLSLRVYTRLGTRNQGKYAFTVTLRS